MKYCADCGTGHDCIMEQEAAEKARVDIVRLETNRDIEVAKINAAAGVQVAETEAEHETGHAEGIVEGVEATLDAVTGGGNAPEGEPITVDTGPAPEVTGDTPEEPEIEGPPEVPEVTEDTGSDSGWWDGYR